MDTKQFVLVLALSLVSMMLWQAWQQDYGSAVKTADPQAVNKESDKPELLLSEPTAESTPDFIEEVKDTVTVTPVDKAPGSGKALTVTTDLYRLEISTKGGGIQKLELLKK